MDRPSKLLGVEEDVKRVISDVSGENVEKTSLESNLFLDFNLNEDFDTGAVYDILEGRYEDINVSSDEMKYFRFVKEIVDYINQKADENYDKKN